MTTTRLQETYENPFQQETSMRQTPLSHVRRLFLSFLQGLFATAPAGCFRWCEGDDTEIVIRDENTLQVSNIGVRPAINLTLGPCNLSRLGINDMDGYGLTNGAMTKSVLVPGTVSLHCSSRNDLVAHGIAWIVAEHLWLLRHLLIGQYRLYDLGLPQIGAPTAPSQVVPGDAGKEWYTSSVTLPWQFHRTSQYMPLNSPVVAAIEARLVPVLRAETPPATPQLAANGSFFGQISTSPALRPDSLQGVRRPAANNPTQSTEVVVYYGGQRRGRGPARMLPRVPFSDTPVENFSPERLVRVGLRLGPARDPPLFRSTSWPLPHLHPLPAQTFKSHRLFELSRPRF